MCFDAEVPRSGVAEVAGVEWVVTGEVVHELVKLVIGFVSPWNFAGGVVCVLVPLASRIAVGSNRALLVFHAHDHRPPFLPVMILLVVIVILNAEVFSVTDKHVPPSPAHLIDVITAAGKTTTKTAIVSNFASFITMIDGIFDGEWEAVSCDPFFESMLSGKR